MTPAVPPDWTGDSSTIVSDPLVRVLTIDVPVARASTWTSAGQGKYSYCHPVSGLVVPFAVRAVENVKLGMAGAGLRGVIGLWIET